MTTKPTIITGKKKFEYFVVIFVTNELVSLYVNFMVEMY